MILFLIAVISALTVPQGGSFNLTLSEQAYVVLDPCMFFEKDLKSSGNYSVGDYVVVVSYGCEAGKKEILLRYSRGLDRILIEVEKAEKVEEKVVELHKEVLSLRKESEELKIRRDYLQSLVSVLNDINVQLYDKQKELAEKNTILSSELDKSKLDLENCTKNVTSLENRLGKLQTALDSAKIEIDRCNSEQESLSSILQSSSSYLEIFKNLAIAALAFIVGVFLAMLRRY
jgi:hypothetical protein